MLTHSADILTISGGNFAGNGSGLTNLNATNLASGTVPTARLGTGTASSSTYLRGDGAWAAPTASLSGGSAGYGAVWSSSSALTYDSALYVDTTNHRIGIGTTSPSYKTQIAGPESTDANSTKTNAILAVAESSAETHGLYFRLRGNSAGIGGGTYENQIIGYGGGGLGLYTIRAISRLERQAPIGCISILPAASASGRRVRHPSLKSPERFTALRAVSSFPTTQRRPRRQQAFPAARYVGCDMQIAMTAPRPRTRILREVWE